MSYMFFILKPLFTSIIIHYDLKNTVLKTNTSEAQDKYFN